MMKNVICDTNIWYGFGKEELSFDDNKFTLFGTILNTEELSITPNIDSDFNLVKGAC